MEAQSKFLKSVYHSYLGEVDLFADKANNKTYCRILRKFQDAKTLKSNLPWLTLVKSNSEKSKAILLPVDYSIESEKSFCSSTYVLKEFLNVPINSL